MKTYIANIETPNGSHQIQLAAVNIQDALARVEARMQNRGDQQARYTIQEQSPAPSSDAMSGLIHASGALIACLIVLVIAIDMLRRHFKG